MNQPRIAIVGAGTGGLVLAAALQQRGWAVDVYEQTPELDEVGAGVALWSNATRLLERLGMGVAIAAQSVQPTAMAFRDGVTGEKIADYPFTEDDRYRKLFGAPYFGIYRRALQRILVDALEADTIHFGCQLTGLQTDDGGRTRPVFNGSEVIDADIVVGADGIRSFVRSWMFDGLDYLMYSRRSGFRGVVPAAALPSLPDPTETTVWMGNGGHLIHFPMTPGHEHITFLAVEEDPKIWPNPVASRVTCEVSDATGRFQGWHPAVTDMINTAAPVERWGLFGVGPLPAWSRGNVVLLGDSAHAMLPHQGQGANLCIEDAVVLADVLTTGYGVHEIPALLQHFTDLRYERVQQVQKGSWVAGRLFHLPDGPETAIRDAIFRDLEPKVSWIHAYDPQNEEVSF